ncbi:hypothetical protein [Vogesella mureinivorans]|uniref:hypothetical protein n=1 Tax=Vogesella mureinivorans TaxID=657276 RepID=UPI0011CA70F9|nr:hypothetical protein [Vogesella mureinivorans]
MSLADTATKRPRRAVYQAEHRPCRLRAANLAAHAYRHAPANAGAYPPAKSPTPAECIKMRQPHPVPLSRLVLQPLAGHGLQLLPAMTDHSQPISKNILSYAMSRMG